MRNYYQLNSSWNAPYTFSGKEKDVETGYGYFGTRYFDSGLSIWLSVDPMSDKYPSMSPYNYCANNPVILVDPDGMRFRNADDEAIIAEYRAALISQRQMIETRISEGADRNGFTKELSEIDKAESELLQLQNSTTVYTFRIERNEDPEKGGQFFMEKSGDEYIGIIQINTLNLGLYSNELKHAFQFDNKELSFLPDGKTVGSLGGFHTEREAYDRGAYVGRDMFQFVTYDFIYTKYIYARRENPVDPNSEKFRNEVLPWMIQSNQIFKQ